MAMGPLARQGHFLHIYDFRVLPGTGDEFIAAFNRYDYSDANPMHRSWAQVKDGVLCRDTADTNHFWLIGEWSDIEEHARIIRTLSENIPPDYRKLIEGGRFVPLYGKVVSSTPQEILDRARR